jgi:hypothetical protein
MCGCDSNPIDHVRGKSRTDSPRMPLTASRTVVLSSQAMVCDNPKRRILPSGGKLFSIRSRRRSVFAQTAENDDSMHGKQTLLPASLALPWTMDSVFNSAAPDSDPRCSSGLLGRLSLTKRLRRTPCGPHPRLMHGKYRWKTLAWE